MIKAKCGLLSAVIIVSIFFGCTNDEMNCSPDDRKGAYDTKIEKVEGDCDVNIEEAPDIIVLSDSSSDHCDVLYADYSDDQCTYTKSMRCYYDDGVGKMDVVSTQLTDDGSEIEGTAVIEWEGLDSTSCRDVYEIRITRR